HASSWRYLFTHGHLGRCHAGDSCKRPAGSKITFGGHTSRRGRIATLPTPAHRRPTVKNLLRIARDQIRHQEIVLVSILLGIAVLRVPVQHYISIAKIQHHAISLLLVTAGFALQSALSWRRLSCWGRLTM